MNGYKRLWKDGHTLTEKPVSEMTRLTIRNEGSKSLRETIKNNVT